VKKHEWFKNIDDWNAYQEMKKVPPFLPVIQGPEDTSNFDPVLRFTNISNSLNKLYIVTLLVRVQAQIIDILTFLGITHYNENNNNII